MLQQPSCGNSAVERKRLYAAVDIGASSGRVTLGQVLGTGESARASMEVVHRFPNGVVDVDGTLRWDVETLVGEVLAGLAVAARQAQAEDAVLASIGIDTWAVDYGLHDADGQLAGQPFAYRDPRSERYIAAVHNAVPEAELYSVTGLQHLPFNTLYQLAAEPDLAGRTALLLPDLIAYRLTGQMRTEETNASTTGLFDAAQGSFSGELLHRLGLPADLFAPLIAPGEAYGTLLPEVAAATNLPSGTPVLAVGSHDTASAVAAVPAAGGAGSFAYISSGTWSLVGVELDAPVLSEASRTANFTNERGVDGTIRYLRNAGGLWLLQECLRQWQADGIEVPALGQLLAAAGDLPAGGPLIDADAVEFIAPGGMPGRIQAALRSSGAGGSDAAGGEPVALVRCIMDSLADCYARTLADAVRLTGQSPDAVHIVGGGSQNPLLCRLTAAATGLPVLAGPVEATSIGNVLVQARSDGAFPGGLAELRSIVARSWPLERYEPLAANPV